MKRMSLLALLILGFCFLLLGVAAYLPSWISTSQGQEWVLKILNRSIKGKISCESIQISWFGSQKIDHFSIEDTEGKTLFSVAHIQMEQGLFDLFNPKTCIHHLVIDHPTLLLSRTHSDHFSLKEALSSRDSPPSHSSTRTRWGWRSWFLICNIQIIEGSANLVSPGLRSVAIRNLQLEYQKDRDFIDFDAITEQEGIQGKCSGSGSLIHGAELTVSFKQFPLGILDQWRGDALATSLLGETLDGSMTTSSKSPPLSVHLDLKTKQLSGSVTASLVNKQWKITPGALFRYDMTPTGFQTLLGSEQKKEWSLSQTAHYVLSIDEGLLPLSPQEWSLESMKVRGSLSIEKVQIFHTISGLYELSNFKAVCNLYKGFQVQSSGSIQNHHIEGSIHLDGALSTAEDLSFQLTSDHFPVLLLGIVLDQADLIRSSIGPWLSIAIQGNYEAGQAKATLSCDSDRTHLHGSIQGKSLDALQFAIEGEHTMEESWAPLIGKTVWGTLQGKAGIWDRNLTLTTVSGSLESDHVSIDISGRLGEKNKPFSCESIQLFAHGKILELPYQERVTQAALEQGLFVMTLDGKENALMGRGELTIAVPAGDALYVSKESRISFTIRNILCQEEWKLRDAYVEASAHLDHLPSQIFTSLFPNQLPPEDLVGPTLDVDAQFTYNPPAIPHHWILKCQARSSSLDVALELEGNQDMLKSKGNANTIRLQLSHDQVYSLVHAFYPDSFFSSWKLAHSLDLNCFIEHIHCPLPALTGSPQRWAEAGMDLAFSCSPIVCKRENEVLVFDHIHGSVSSEELQDAATCSFSSSIRGSTLPTYESGYLSFQATVSQLWQENQWKWEQSSVDGECEAHNVPMRQLFDLLPLSPEVAKGYQSLVGEFLNAYGSVHWVQGEGPVDLEIHASHGQVICPLQLTQSGFLLRAPLYAHLQLTEELAEWLLIDVNPLLITGAFSPTPITFEIDPNGFFFPLHPFTFKGIRIPKATLDIGKIQIRNGGQIQSLMEFLKADDMTEDQWMEAWCTPIYMSLAEGTSHYERFDLLLARTVHIALWGRIDLVKNKVKMTLGIDPATLAKRFRVHGLSSSDMFQVKMRGPANDVELDWSSAYTRIGIILARLTGGNLVYLVGGVLDQILSVFGDEATPPPTTQPLPWEHEIRK